MQVWDAGAPTPISSSPWAHVHSEPRVQVPCAQELKNRNVLPKASQRLPSPPAPRTCRWCVWCLLQLVLQPNSRQNALSSDLRETKVNLQKLHQHHQTEEPGHQTEQPGLGKILLRYTGSCARNARTAQLSVLHPEACDFDRPSGLDHRRLRLTGRRLHPRGLSIYPYLSDHPWRTRIHVVANTPSREVVFCTQVLQTAH